MTVIDATNIPLNGTDITAALQAKIDQAATSSETRTCVIGVGHGVVSALNIPADTKLQGADRVATQLVSNSNSGDVITMEGGAGLFDMTVRSSVVRTHGALVRTKSQVSSNRHVVNRVFFEKGFIGLHVDRTTHSIETSHCSSYNETPVNIVNGSCGMFIDGAIAFVDHFMHGPTGAQNASQPMACIRLGFTDATIRGGQLLEAQYGILADPWGDDPAHPVVCYTSIEQVHIDNSTYKCVQLRPSGQGIIDTFKLHNCPWIVPREGGGGIHLDMVYSQRDDRLTRASFRGNHLSTYSPNVNTGIVLQGPIHSELVVADNEIEGFSWGLSVADGMKNFAIQNNVFNWIGGGTGGVSIAGGSGCNDFVVSGNKRTGGSGGFNIAPASNGQIFDNH